jgi:hypothetical protein
MKSPRLSPEIQLSLLERYSKLRFQIAPRPSRFGALFPSLARPTLPKAAILAALLTLAFCCQALAVQPLDLAELGRRGLGQKSRDIIVTQALTVRARPPLEIGVVLEMAAYGGDELARSYLEMDAKTNQMAESPLPPRSVRNLIAAGIPAEEIKAMIESAAGSDSSQAEKPAPIASSPAVAETLSVAASDQPAEAPQAPYEPYRPSFTVEDIAPAPAPAPASPFASVKEAIAPAPPAPPAVPQPPSPADLRKVPQSLAPGQSADPARPLPEPPGPYWTRMPEPGKRFMGVTDVVKADGHRYEVHTNARTGYLGQEVLSRASGHKVIRHFNSRPEPPAPPRAPDSAAEDGYADGADGWF